MQSIPQKGVNSVQLSHNNSVTTPTALFSSHETRQLDVLQMSQAVGVTIRLKNAPIITWELMLHVQCVGFNCR